MRSCVIVHVNGNTIQVIQIMLLRWPPSSANRIQEIPEDVLFVLDLTLIDL